MKSLNRLPGLDAITVAREGLIIGARERQEAFEAAVLASKDALLIATKSHFS